MWLLSPALDPLLLGSPLRRPRVLWAVAFGLLVQRIPAADASPATAPAAASQPAAAPLVTTDQLLTLVRTLPATPGHARCAVFDADGTLWDFDLSSTLVRQTLQQRTASPAGLPAMNALLREFGLPAGADIYQATQTVDAAFDSGQLHALGRQRGWDEDAVNARLWPHYNWLYVGLPPAALGERARRWIGRPEQQTRIFAGMRALVAALRERGFELRVISGGVHEFVEAGARELGFAPDEVRGLRLRVEQGRLTADVEQPVPYQQGKATIARALCGGRPQFAFGDSVATGDRAMLELAAVPVAVRPIGRHLEAARARPLDL